MAVIPSEIEGYWLREVSTEAGDDISFHNISQNGDFTFHDYQGDDVDTDRPAL